MPIYIAARDLAGMVPIGTHQFIIIESTSCPYISATLDNKPVAIKSIGKGKMGYVVGAHNRDNLEAIFFERADYDAALEYFDKSRVRFYKSDYDTEVIEVKFPKIHEHTATRKIFDLINNYHMNQSIDKIKYPMAGLGFNSNSWAQTVIALAGGIVQSDLKGFDISNNKRIPETYFMPVCPAKPRKKIN